MEGVRVHVMLIRDDFKGISEVLVFLRGILAEIQMGNDNDLCVSSWDNYLQGPS